MSLQILFVFIFEKFEERGAGRTVFLGLGGGRPAVRTSRPIQGVD